MLEDAPETGLWYHRGTWVHTKKRRSARNGISLDKINLFIFNCSKTEVSNFFSLKGKHLRSCVPRGLWRGRLTLLCRMRAVAHKTWRPGVAVRQQNCIYGRRNLHFVSFPRAVKHFSSFFFQPLEKFKIHSSVTGLTKRGSRVNVALEP